MVMTPKQLSTSAAKIWIRPPIPSSRQKQARPHTISTTQRCIAIPVFYICCIVCISSNSKFDKSSLHAPHHVHCLTTALYCAHDYTLLLTLRNCAPGRSKLQEKSMGILHSGNDNRYQLWHHIDAPQEHKMEGFADTGPEESPNWVYKLCANVPFPSYWSEFLACTLLGSRAEGMASWKLVVR